MKAREAESGARPLPERHLRAAMERIIALADGHERLLGQPVDIVGWIARAPDGEGGIYQRLEVLLPIIHDPNEVVPAEECAPPCPDCGGVICFFERNFGPGWRRCAGCGADYVDSRHFDCGPALRDLIRQVEDLLPGGQRKRLVCHAEEQRHAS